MNEGFDLIGHNSPKVDLVAHLQYLQGLRNDGFGVDYEIHDTAHDMLRLGQMRIEEYYQLCATLDIESPSDFGPDDRDRLG